MSLGVIIDIWQTMMIIALTVVVALSMRGVDRQFKTLHHDVQDTIVSQYAMLKQLEDLQTDVNQVEGRVRKLEDA
jgi:hypothetical protein